MTATGLEASFRLNSPIRRCNGHHGIAHAPLQGQYKGVNCTAVAAAYPIRFCKAILDDILTYVQPKGFLRAVRRQVLQNHLIYYKRERCEFGGAATRDMVHAYLAGKCRYGRIPKEKTSGSLQLFYSRCRLSTRSSTTCRTEGSLTVDASIELSREEVVYFKHLCCEIVEDSVNVFEEADGKEIS